MRILACFIVMLWVFAPIPAKAKDIWPDAGKACQDGAECKSGYCLAKIAICNGVEFREPRTVRYETCESYQGACWGDKFPPGGCQVPLNKGVYKVQCRNR